MTTSPQRPAAVLFDCDGVLIDTEITSAVVMSRKLAELGVHQTPDEVREQIKGTSLAFVQALATELNGGPLPDGWFDDFFEQRQQEYARGVEQIPGAADAVRAVQAAGIPLAIVSQGARRKMAITLPASGMDAVLGDAPIFSGDDVERGKPHPDLYLLAAQQLGVDPAACVVVEDSPTGVQGAHAAGMRVLAFSPDSDPAKMAAAGGEVFFDLHEVAWRLGLADPPAAAARAGT